MTCAESSDHYPAEICRVVLPGKSFRIIECRDGIQWVIQHSRRGAGKQATGRWRAVAYPTTKSALMRLWREKTGSIVPEIAALPAGIQHPRQTRQ
ncbi:hypothetical protein [Paracoccus sp. AS002]|uniref:hypothetical protein n=1 Tax=Paracoccus sp. AS002 TaxID=3019545 RepID=UPI0023E7C864|nr:hypothetical protein [Paracoccus sp. AS002]MDF3907262.1 hypothetical protein [Paracoccus sp. AS002]